MLRSGSPPCLEPRGMGSAEPRYGPRIGSFVFRCSAVWTRSMLRRRQRLWCMRFLEHRDDRSVCGDASDMHACAFWSAGMTEEITSQQHAGLTEQERVTDRARRGQMYRRRRIVIFSALGLVVLLLLGGGLYTGVALGTPLPVLVPTMVAPSADLPTAPTVAEPGFGAWAVGIAEVSSGTGGAGGSGGASGDGATIPVVGSGGLIAASNENVPLPMASITKIITALVLLEAHPVTGDDSGPSILYTAKDLEIYKQVYTANGSVAPVSVGSTLTLRQSLEAMLLPSGNNYAISLANWAFGSEAAFLDRARAWLATQGLTQTKIADTNGLSLEDISTATDLVRLGKLALANPLVATIVAMPNAVVGPLGLLQNTNKLLGNTGITGIKTGTTDTAANLLFSANIPVAGSSVTVVGVLLDGKNHTVINTAVLALVTSLAPGFRLVNALTAQQELAHFRAAWDAAATARAATGVSIIVWGSTTVTVSVALDSVRAVTRGEKVGTATVRAGDHQFPVSITVDGAITDPGFWWRMAHPGGLAQHPAL